MTPEGDGIRIGMPSLWDHDCGLVHISCVFTWDKGYCERLADSWGRVSCEVELGGPAYGASGGGFESGLYVKSGYVMTSRGCNNRCWFCTVWRREGDVREIPIVDGWNVLDSSLLQCSEGHIRSVFGMLARQSRRAVFSGGLEAARLEDWHLDLLAELKPQRVYFAYDTADDYEPLVVAARKLLPGVFSVSSHTVACYVLVGYPRDTFEAAESRLRAVLGLGMTPFAMLYRDEQNVVREDWRPFVRRWVRPEIIYAGMRSSSRLYSV